MKVEVSNGELVDKYIILKIKQKKIKNNEKQQYIQKELNYLSKIVKQLNVSTELYSKLYLINEKLWNVEDNIRIKERKLEFDNEFIQLARDVYKTNDIRANIKKKINQNTKSEFHEVKLLPQYKSTFLYYNFLPSLADHVLDFDKYLYLQDGIKPRHDSKPFIPGNIKENDIVFIKVDLLETFFNFYYPNINHPFYLLSGVGGMDVKEKFAQFLDQGKIIHWIGCNIIWNHPKVTKIPIGFEEEERSRDGPASGIGGDQALLYELYEQRLPFFKKKKKLLMTHMGETHQCRKQIHLHNNDFIDVLEKKDFVSYMNTINNYQFVLCPRGSGTDTHRFWEVCLMGSIPIVERNKLSDLYERVPCLIVDSFNNINYKMLEEFKYEGEKEVNNFLFLDKFVTLVHKICKKN